MLNLEDVKLTKADKEHAEAALRNWNTLSHIISEQKLDGLRTLLAYEVSTRMRLTVIQRLVARYGVLEQQANEREVMALVAKRMARQ